MSLKNLLIPVLAVSISGNIYAFGPNPARLAEQYLEDLTGTYPPDSRAAAQAVIDQYNQGMVTTYSGSFPRQVHQTQLTAEGISGFTSLVSNMQDEVGEYNDVMTSIMETATPRNTGFNGNPATNPLEMQRRLNDLIDQIESDTGNRPTTALPANFSSASRTDQERMIRETFAALTTEVQGDYAARIQQQQTSIESYCQSNDNIRDEEICTQSLPDASSYVSQLGSGATSYIGDFYGDECYRVFRGSYGDRCDQDAEAIQATVSSFDTSMDNFNSSVVRAAQDSLSEARTQQRELEEEFEERRAQITALDNQEQDFARIIGAMMGEYDNAVLDNKLLMLDAKQLEMDGMNPSDIDKFLDQLASEQSFRQRMNDTVLGRYVNQVAGEVADTATASARNAVVELLTDCNFVNSLQSACMMDPSAQVDGFDGATDKLQFLQEYGTEQLDNASQR